MARHAVFEWLQKHSQTNDLFAAIALVLQEADPVWFNLTRNTLQTGSSSFIEQLDSNLYLIVSYLEQVKQKRVIKCPDMSAIAQKDMDHFVHYAELALSVAVLSDRSMKFIRGIQELDPKLQHALKRSIERAMSNMKDTGSSSVAELQALNDKLTVDNARLATRIREFEAALKLTQESGNSDALLKQQISHLTAQLETTETHGFELEAQVRNLEAKLAELKRNANKDSDTTRIDDSHVSDMAIRLRKSEEMLQKYKDRLSDAADDKTLVNMLQEDVVQLQQKYEVLESQHRMAAGLRPLVDTYKSQVSQLEEKIILLQSENQTLAAQSANLKSANEQLEADRNAQSDKLTELHEQMYELQLAGPPVQSLSSESANAKLTAKLASCEKELNQTQEKLWSGSKKLIVMENRLADAVNLKVTAERKCREAEAARDELRSEFELLKSKSGASAKDSEEIEKAMMRIRELEAQQVSQAVITEKELAIEQAAKDNLAYKHKIEELQSKISSLSSDLDEARKNAITAKREETNLRATLASVQVQTNADQTTERLASATQKVVRLTSQNAELHQALKKAKEHILAQEKLIQTQNSEASVSDKDEELITSLKSTLKEKEAQLERLKQELVDIRASARREQRLMTSAVHLLTQWHELASKVHSKSPAKSSSWLRLHEQ